MYIWWNYSRKLRKGKGAENPDSIYHALRYRGREIANHT